VANAEARLSAERYDPVARALHWLVAGLAVIVVAGGLAIPGAPRESHSREVLLLLHRSVGLLLLALMLVRIVWRAGHPPPPRPPGLSQIEASAARADQALLYLLFLVMPLSGYVAAAAAGHPVSIFGIIAIPPLLPESDRLSQIADAVHLAGQFLVYAAVGVHVAAALMHRIVRRDGVFERMLPRRRGS